VQHFGGFIHQIKVRQPVGSKDSIKPCAEEAGGWMLFCFLAAQNFEFFSNIQVQILKK
jgi:hypothetical protein